MILPDINLLLNAHNLEVPQLQENHMQEVIRLMAESNCSGLLASDASLAVYAMKHRAVLHSNDSDFSRFSGLNWRNPLVV